MSDLIRRENAIKAIKAEARCAGGAVAEEYADMFIYAILHVKGVDAERKGEWIKRFGSINCSACGKSHWSACFEDLVRSFNYCPNCGARMKGADDETD